MSTFLHEIRYGDVATWFAAVGTVSVAIWLLVLQLRDRRRTREQNRREQAQTVAGWLHKNDHQADPPALVVRVLNGSALPIFNVSIRVEVGVRGTFVRWVEAMAPHETREWRIVLPGYPRGTVLAPEVMFTDMAKVTWIRRSGGDLSEPTLDEQQAARTQDPGAYGSESEHPTLSAASDDWEAWSGRRVE
jgi:hypothetical protein